jgi:hypothetical protein
VSINASGQIVGFYYDSSNHAHGFLDNNGTFSTIDPPGSIDTQILGINDAGQMVGNYIDSSYQEHAFEAIVAPVMLDAVYNPATNLTTLSGTAEANSSVSIRDGTS